MPERFHLAGGGQAEVGEDNPLPVTASGALPAGTNNIGDIDVLTMPDVRESWRVSTLSDATANDSDKTFTVPANTEYEVLSIGVTLVTTADVGARRLAVLFLSATDVILGQAYAEVTQAASLTYVYVFSPALTTASALGAGNTVAVQLPHMFLTAGQKIRVYDSAAIAAAADDMTVAIQLASRSVA